MHALVLAPHVSLLCFFQLWGKLVDVFDVDEGLREVVSFPDGLEPSVFGRETNFSVEVGYGWLDAGDIVHIVDCFLRRGSVLHEYREVLKH